MSAQQTIEELNDRFGIDGQISFIKGSNDFIIADISNQFASAQITLYGAHVLHYQRRNDQPILWLSESVVYQVGKAIRGGVPICWPWFGPHPTDSSKPAHGLARIMDWSVDATEAMDDGAVRIQLSLSHNPATLALWPHEFKFVASITVGDKLSVALTTHNLSQQTIECSGAMHTYFNISDSTISSIHGLDQVQYIDKLDNSNTKLQQGPIPITESMDRVYINTDSTCEIHDAGNKRKIVIEKSGSHSTVVWNPWKEAALTIKDFDDDGYLHMVCVESCNAGPDAVQIQPGATHTLETRITTIPAD